MADAVHVAIPLMGFELRGEQLAVSVTQGRVDEVGAAVREDLAKQGDEGDGWEHVGLNVHRTDHMVLKTYQTSG